MESLDFPKPEVVRELEGHEKGTVVALKARIAELEEEKEVLLEYKQYVYTFVKNFVIAEVLALPRYKLMGHVMVRSDEGDYLDRDQVAALTTEGKGDAE